jgi:hypothetical protein
VNSSQYGRFSTDVTRDVKIVGITTTKWRDGSNQAICCAGRKMATA